MYVFGLAAAEQRDIRPRKVESGHRNRHVIHIEIASIEGWVLHPLIVSQIFVHFAVIQRGQQIFFIVRQRDIPRIGHDRTHLPARQRLPRIIDQHTRQQFGLRILMFDPDTHIVVQIEKQPVLELDHLLLPSNIVNQGRHLLECQRSNIVCKEKATDRNEKYQDQ